MAFALVSTEAPFRGRRRSSSESLHCDSGRIVTAAGPGLMPVIIQARVIGPKPEAETSARAGPSRHVDITAGMLGSVAGRLNG